MRWAVGCAEWAKSRAWPRDIPVQGGQELRWSVLCAAACWGLEVDVA